MACLGKDSNEPFKGGSDLWSLHMVSKTYGSQD